MESVRQLQQSSAAAPSCCQKQEAADERISQKNLLKIESARGGRVLILNGIPFLIEYGLLPSTDPQLSLTTRNSKPLIMSLSKGRKLWPK